MWNFVPVALFVPIVSKAILKCDGYCAEEAGTKDARWTHFETNRRDDVVTLDTTFHNGSDDGPGAGNFTTDDDNFGAEAVYEARDSVT